jgi:hypothetical protein
MKRRLFNTSSDSDCESSTNLDPEPPFKTSSESDSYLDPDTEPDIRPDLDIEGEYLRKRIDYHESEGRAKPRRSNWTNSLVKREFEYWQKQVPTSHILYLFLLLTIIV